MKVKLILPALTEAKSEYWRSIGMSPKRALEEIDSLRGRHLFFLDDNIFGNPEFSRLLCQNLVGSQRVWQGAATISSLSDAKLVELAAESGCRSLFIGFETINRGNLDGYRRRLEKVRAPVDGAHQPKKAVSGRSCL